MACEDIRKNLAELRAEKAAAEEFTGDTQWHGPGYEMAQENLARLNREIAAEEQRLAVCETAANSPEPGESVLRKRKNQSALTDDEWERLIQAMKWLKDDKGSRNWDYFTETHAKYSSHDNDHNLPHQDGEDLTIHSPVYWLPWHRQFILEFEERLRDFDNSIELPYWNWAFYREIPKDLTKKIGGWMNVPRAVFHNGDKLPSAEELNRVKAATTFASFDSLSTLHGDVHVWVGGAMADMARSPRDPLFFLHHCFLDKVWADWQAVHHPSLFPSEYREMEMPPWNKKVQDVLHIGNVGYEYGPK